MVAGLAISFWTQGDRSMKAISGQRSAISFLLAAENCCKPYAQLFHKKRVLHNHCIAPIRFYFMAWSDQLPE